MCRKAVLRLCQLLILWILHSPSYPELGLFDIFPPCPKILNFCEFFLPKISFAWFAGLVSTLVAGKWGSLDRLLFARTVLEAVGDLPAPGDGKNMPLCSCESATQLFSPATRTLQRNG